MKLLPFAHDIISECGCNNTPIVGPSLVKESNSLSKNMKFHIENGISLYDNYFRAGSSAHAHLIREGRELWEAGTLNVAGMDKELFETTDLGKFGMYEGKEVMLDFPMVEAEYQGKEVPLGKPKRGGPKKYYVYVKSDSGNVKKVTFGDTTGLKAKISDPKARAAFAARHQCDKKKDRTKAGYWACRLTRYGKLLGFGKNYPGYW